MHVGGGTGQPAASSISQVRGSCERRASGLEREIFVDLCRKAETKDTRASGHCYWKKSAANCEGLGVWRWSE